MPRILRRSSAFVVGGLITLVIACSDGKKEDDDQFREDTLTCEEALAHLLDCCPNFDPNAVACRYYYASDQGCSSSEVTRETPAFNLQESRCIRNKSCADLQQLHDDASLGKTNICGRAAAAVQYVDRTTTGTGSPTSFHQAHPPVCP
jgi:hypothetical protein